MIVIQMIPISAVPGAEWKQVQNFQKWEAIKEWNVN